MNDRTDHLIALAVTGEITQHEQAELDELLDADVELLTEMDRALETAVIVQSATAELPPAHLRDLVMGAIAETPQVRRPMSTVEAQPETESESAVAPVIDMASRRRNRWVQALSAAAAVVLLAGVGVVALVGDSPSEQEDLAAQAQVVMSANDAVTRQLRGSLEGQISIVYSADEAAIAIEGDGLPVLDDSKEFALWLVHEDGADLVSTFRPDEAGDVLLRVDGVDPSEYVVGLTQEDVAGFDQTPTLPIIASA